MDSGSVAGTVIDMLPENDFINKLINMKKLKISVGLLMLTLCGTVYAQTTNQDSKQQGTTTKESTQTQ